MRELWGRLRDQSRQIDGKWPVRPDLSVKAT
jgi:hypothetical protein